MGHLEKGFMVCFMNAVTHNFSLAISAKVMAFLDIFSLFLQVPAGWIFQLAECETQREVVGDPCRKRQPTLTTRMCFSFDRVS